MRLLLLCTCFAPLGPLARAQIDLPGTNDLCVYVYRDAKLVGSFCEWETDEIALVVVECENGKTKKTPSRKKADGPTSR